VPLRWQNDHRIDDEDSGVFICAKTKSRALDFLSGQFQEKTFGKKILAPWRVASDAREERRIVLCDNSGGLPDTFAVDFRSVWKTNTNAFGRFCAC